MKNRDQIKKRIDSEPDFIYCPRLGNSIKKLLNVVDNSNGVDDERICKLLLIDQSELDKIYASAIQKLRFKMLEEQ